MENKKESRVFVVLIILAFSILTFVLVNSGQSLPRMPKTDIWSLALNLVVFHYFLKFVLWIVKNSKN